MFQLLIKQRTGWKRSMILVSIGLLFVHDLYGKQYTYLYTRKKFGWNEQQYTVFASVESVHGAARAFMVTPFLNKVQYNYLNK